MISLRSSQIRPLLVPLEWLYRWIIAVRNAGYDYKYLLVRRVEDVKVISVGNLTAGGSGKTPVTEWFVKILREKGCRLAVVSRGYGRYTTGTMVVSDEQRTYLNALQAGDEPLMLALHLRGVPVVVSENRYRGVVEAKQKFGIDSAVLDDGFQHRKIFRDLDVVVMDVRQFSEWTSPRQTAPHLLPVGTLREPVKNLSRADLVILTHTRPGIDYRPLKEQIGKNTRAAMLEVRYRPKELVSLRTGEKRPLGDLKNAVVVPFAGIAYPGSFFSSLEVQGANLVGKFPFPDHHYFTEKELELIATVAHQRKADFVITTEKDSMRLLDRSLPFECYAMPIELEFPAGTELVYQILREKKLIDPGPRPKPGKKEKIEAVK